MVSPGNRSCSAGTCRHAGGRLDVDGPTELQTSTARPVSSGGRPTSCRGDHETRRPFRDTFTDRCDRLLTFVRTPPQNTDPERAHVSEESNWAGNHQYQAQHIVHPTSTAEVQELVATSHKARALGSRHSFNAIADSPGTLIALGSIAPGIEIDPISSTVRVTAGTRYGVLAEELHKNGYALHNLASLPHISIGGAVATGTHGSGDGNGNLATAVVAMDIITDSGEITTVRRGDTPDFDGMVISLGALGIVVQVTLTIIPSFHVRQDVFTDVPWSAVLENFDDVTSSAYSISLFTDWRGDSIRQAWLKSRVDAPTPVSPSFFGGMPATTEMHPLPGMSARHCTQQMGTPGPWTDRLPHFRMNFVPSSGQELQTEYVVGREHAVEALQMVRSLHSRIVPLLQVSEIRTMAADSLWLSNNHQRAGIGIHFTWKPDQSAVEALLPELEAALAPLECRPHWGKLFAAHSTQVASLYPKFDDFCCLVDRWDPEGKFRNEFLDQRLFAHRSTSMPTG